MELIFSRIAIAELNDAACFYEAEFAGLGQEFRDEVEAAAHRIMAYPQAWSVERNEIRKCLLHKFPYKILYAVESDHIVVIAIAHQHRQPDYWVGRQDEQ